MSRVDNMDTDALRPRLHHVRWIGGASGAGKSTIARRLAAEHGLGVYATDDVMSEHARRTTSGESPLLAEFMAMDMDERWLNRSPTTMLETFHWFQGEGFRMIIEDLLELPAEPGVIAEGFRLLPDRVKPLAGAGQAVWLLPTPEFREAAVDSRLRSWEFLDTTSDPARARRNLLERDRMFTDRLRAETTRLGLPAIEVDVDITEDELAARVEDSLGL